jgi:hypothetical protein
VAVAVAVGIVAVKPVKNAEPKLPPGTGKRSPNQQGAMAVHHSMEDLLVGHQAAMAAHLHRIMVVVAMGDISKGHPVDPL